MANPEISFLPLMCDLVPENFRKRAEAELGESEESTKEGLRKLREFLKNENYPPNNDDTFLLQFLRQQKFNISKAEKKLKQHYSMREKTAELYQSIDLEIVRSIMDSRVVGLLPYRDAEGRTIVYTNAKAVDLERFKASDLFKCTLALFHFACSFPLTSVSGLNLLGEAAYPRVNDAIKIFKESMNFVWIQNACPFRVQRIDFFNEFASFRYLWKGVSVFLPSKYSKRTNQSSNDPAWEATKLRLHGSSMDFVHNVYHPSILPNEFGGTMGPLNNDSYLEEFLEYTKKLKAECYLYRNRC